ncbi:hypothetical protein GOP47_0007698 [Adiantum capillus-veneris]|uniref:Secreted protein n=1 Tax=Adiantum capillus-veneris TaxID=13818 RepID=A0A9D4ZJJ6_ADICA|nr:hypothetical protein GOP47_0007698 [Adiantum capillus-veneris]
MTANVHCPKAKRKLLLLIGILYAPLKSSRGISAGDTQHGRDSAWPRKCDMPHPEIAIVSVLVPEIPQRTLVDSHAINSRVPKGWVSSPNPSVQQAVSNSHNCLQGW